VVYHLDMESTLTVGTKVIDRDGFTGTIVKVTEWRGSVWYDVRLGRTGDAVRFPSDLTVVEVSA
jgi:preprotein translocase subunit YajC